MDQFGDVVNEVFGQVLNWLCKWVTNNSYELEGSTFCKTPPRLN